MSQARTLRRHQTTAEQNLWSRLRDRQLKGRKFKRQVPRGAYVVDFACLREKLIVELDGGQHADSHQREKDRQRAAWLEGEGYRVLRFWNDEVVTNMDGVLSVIAEALKDAPHPGPLPPKELCGEREKTEQRLWSRLRNRQLEGHKFRRRVPLGRYIVDFSCYDVRLVVELDGGQHGTLSEEDALRTAWLENRGFRVLRFWNIEVEENVDSVLTRILEELETR